MNRTIIGLAVSLLMATPVTADVHITMQDGRVTIVARDATVRQILTEWARVGQAKIVNVERIPGGPVTIELKSVTETQALDVLLRPLSGYILAPRAVVGPNMSTFDRIIIMPTLAAARAPATSAATTASLQPPPAVALPPPQFQPPVEDADDQPARDPDERPTTSTSTVTIAPPAHGVPALNPSPVHSVEIAPQGVVPGGGVVSMPAAAQAPAGSPRSPVAPGGVAVPGMVVPAPQQAQPGQRKAGAPGQPVRPPGGQ